MEMKNKDIQFYFIRQGHAVNLGRIPVKPLLRGEQTWVLRPDRHIPD